MTPLPLHTRQTLVLGSVAGALLAGSLGLAASPALADYKAAVQNGTLQINGDKASDKLVVAGDPTTLLVDVGADGTTDFSFARTSFNAINISAGGGDDAVTIDRTAGLTTPVPITIDGGGGDDTLIGSDGDETFSGGGGNDFVDGNRGNDTALLGAGADRFQWDPGDGSDTVEGQGGKDALDFNGSNAAEKIDVTANGSRVRLFRDVAAITMDLAGVEALNVRNFGGADTTTVGDLTGTDLRDATVDLNAVTGDGDGAADSVVANGTDQADDVDVSTDAGGAAVVSGLATDVHVVGGEAANDRVSVAGLGGDDQLSSGVDLTSPVSAHLIGGEGNDTATYAGSRGDDAIGIALNASEVDTFTASSSPVDSATENLIVQGAAGNDTISGQNGIAGLTKLTVDGGAGDDTLGGGDGDDLLLGGGGDDHVDGNRGSDTALLGGGADRFQWDPGDGSDTVEGQGGKDAMDFNGSNAAEKIDVSANGPRVRLFRDVAAITMDFAGIEGVNVRALGSADQITLGDLSGTDVTAAGIDLSATGGGGDGAADTVIQNGTADADRVRVTRTDTGVLVNGLAPDTTITGGEPANDRLQLNTLGGNDLVTIGSGVSDVIAPSVDLGADQ